jgi:hypothetical protein
VGGGCCPSCSRGGLATETTLLPSPFSASHSPSPLPLATTPTPPRPPALDALLGASHVLTSIPPAGLPLYDPVTRGQLAALRARAEAAAAGRTPPLTWLGVLSSTSVYGDHQGAWVDEG